MNPQPPIGVILAQIGTPAAPTAQAVRPYLRRFLSDRRIIDYPPLLWQPLLRGIILRVRPRRSARLYKEIWSEAGSPLLLHSRAQQAGLQKLLGPDYRVELGLAYSEPGMEQAMSLLEKAGVTRIIIVPLFPQYSSTTTASVYDAACFAALGRHSAGGPVTKRFVPTLRFMEAYYDAPGYISAMQAHLQRQLADLPEEPDYYVLTFHGIPERYADTGDPYPQQCKETARLLAAAMNWEEGRWQVTFQSRFGREPWVGPATAEVLGELAGRGIRRPMIFSPGLVTDCLETLHELAVEGRELFAAGGGDAAKFCAAPCLNADGQWLDFLARNVIDNAGSWQPQKSRLPAEICEESGLR
ncbi:ferrochelatase [Paenibacillus albidus]|uniref:ferrochelatase n=1 Tax=Paenibacillus albidus TaxID=2041023 RepID=UPI001BEC9E34|nr:ferrochelatase [Paenibacillus albidus]MBT2289732.1 ferrochelatase [Paenibacillus albidus]